MPALAVTSTLSDTRFLAELREDAVTVRVGAQVQTVGRWDGVRMVGVNLPPEVQRDLESRLLEGIREFHEYLVQD